MTARASSEPERQSAASAAREFRDSFEMSLGGPMFAATDDAQLERIAGWFERDLAQLLESRERPLLEQVAALREALADTLPAKDSMRSGERMARSHSTVAVLARGIRALASTESAAREFVARVREEERAIYAPLQDAAYKLAAICEDVRDMRMGGVDAESPQAEQVRRALDSQVIAVARAADAIHARARSQTEGA